MKAVLMSIKPEWCSLIASGEKTIEVRKSKPKIKTPFKVYIYCTASNKHTGLVVSKDNVSLIATINYKTGIPIGGCMGNGKVIGEFVCNKITEFFPERYPFKEDGTCLTPLQIMDYANGKKAYGWHISDLVVYEEPKYLIEFTTIDKAAIKECIFRHRDIINPDYTNGGILKGGYSCCQKQVEVNFCRPFENEDCKCVKNVFRPPQSWCYVEEMNNG